MVDLLCAHIAGVIADACHIAWTNIVDNRDVPVMGASGEYHN